MGYSKTLGVEMSFTGRDQHVHSVNTGSSHRLLSNFSLPSMISSQDVCPPAGTFPGYSLCSLETTFSKYWGFYLKGHTEDIFPLLLRSRKKKGQKYECHL